MNFHEGDRWWHLLNANYIVAPTQFTHKAGAGTRRSSVRQLWVCWLWKLTHIKTEQLASLGRWVRVDVCVLTLATLRGLKHLLISWVWTFLESEDKYAAVATLKGWLLLLLDSGFGWCVCVCVWQLWGISLENQEAGRQGHSINLLTLPQGAITQTGNWVWFCIKRPLI